MKKVMKKYSKKKAVHKKKAVKKAKISVKKKDEGKLVGEVSTFFSHVSVIAIKLSGALAVGDKINVKGHTTDFKQKVVSMQIENEKVMKAKKGDHVGIKVNDKARPGDKVFLIK